MPFAQQRRINERLLEYWRKVRRDRPFPMENEINPEAIESIWDSCFVVRAEPPGEPTEFRYVYLGEALIEAYGDEMNSKEVCEKLAYPANNELIARFKDVIDSRSPVTEEAEFTNSRGMLIKFRSCMLPLAKDNPDQVGYVIGAMKWKAE